ncbi:hypothetical protein [Thiosulfativibrio zosterae]|uniref:Lipoprotein n=1 Tax=Thiosulfativibrio zosterae TaxID=2675053 RepID=A0A6F8PMY1_9GAMM|nr:hypothetical protein [Thiosulfativibrio zosterae]BBP43397.1 hypothetical protein THMIRHAT_11430 [Thiosulfativibrio zosterae]
MKNKLLMVLLSASFLIGVTACSSAPTGPDKEYQKRSAEVSDQQLDREVDKLKK